MNTLKNQIDAIVRREFSGTPSYPLEARQCMHWANVDREDILVSFLPDLKRVLDSEGKEAAASEVGALEIEIRQRLNISCLAS